MNYLYHMVPEDMKGKILMPLNEIRNKYPKIYEEEIRKYKGREVLLSKNVPILNCLWNDVLFLTAVHPLKLKRALRESGSQIPLKRKAEWFKIDPKLIDPQKTVVDLYTKREDNNEDYIPFRTMDLNLYDEIGPKTRQYFRKELSEGRRPLLFHLVPHILYKGHLKIKDLEAIEI